MVHVPAATVRSELLAVPEMPRFTVAKGRDGFEPTLLFKASSLLIKYLISLKKFGLSLFRADGGELGYAIRVDDDPNHPAVVWSVARTSDEIRALKLLLRSPRCVIFLFNEAAVNVAWAEADIDIASDEVRSLVNEARPTRADLNYKPQNLGAISGMICSKASPSSDLVFLRDVEVTEWHAIRNSYITNRVGVSELSIFELDEGSQQEALALWLTDGLHPQGATTSPSIILGGKPREFTDVLLTYDFGSFLIESKTLNIFGRAGLPSRPKLTLNVEAHVRKATGQLAGALRAARSGRPITKGGKEVNVELGVPPHVIVLVPDLTLLHRSEEFGGSFIEAYSKKHSAFLHILDTTELLRMVQAAQMLSEAGETTTQMMAFDAHLIKRFEYGLQSTTPDFDFLLKLV